MLKWLCGHEDRRLELQGLKQTPPPPPCPDHFSLCVGFSLLGSFLTTESLVPFPASVLLPPEKRETQGALRLSATG